MTRGAPDTPLARARALRASGDRAGAVEAFRAAVRHAPDAAAPAFGLCAALLEAGRPEAATLLDGLLARFPADAAGWEEVGAVLLAAGKRDAALLCLARAVAAAARPDLLLRQGALLREAARAAEAEAAFAAAVALDPGSVRGWFLLGLCRQDRRDLDGAAAAYRSALALKPDLAEAEVNLGTALQEAGDLAGAKAAYARALACRPDTFGRIAQAVTAAPQGELWLDLGVFRRSLGG